MNEELFLFYYEGWELSSFNKEFPKWFRTEREKIACLLGYNDNYMEVVRDKEEILAEIEKLTK